MKRNRINTIMSLLAFLIMSSGCSDYLDVTPTTKWKVEDFYSSEAEVEMALAGIYGQLANDDVYGYSFSIILEAGTDESYTNDPNNASWDAAKFAFTPSDDHIKGAWLQFYSCIQLTNLFEQNLDREAFDIEKYNALLAKARFYRALCYYNLATWWGPVPLMLEPSYSQEDNDIAASPVIDVYEQVEQDLLFAAKHLYHSKNSDYILGEPNKMAAHGLLARLYLKMGGYQPYLGETDAECYFPNNEQYFSLTMAQCDTIINDGWHGIVPFSEDNLSYRTHFLSYLQDEYDLKESLFEISFGNLNDMGISVHGRLGNTNGVEFVGAVDIPRGFCKVNVGLPVYEIYSQEDVRRKWNIAGYRNKYNSSNQYFTMSYIFDKPLHQEYGIGKYRRWEPEDIDEVEGYGNNGQPNADYVILNNTEGSATDGNFTSINFPILRYSDVLLMYAEASIGSNIGTDGASAKAVEYLNIVRSRSGLDDYSGGLSHDDFFEALVDERLRELCFEGLRKQDLIRWNLLEEKLQETNQSIRNNGYYTEGNQYHTTFLAPGENFDRSKHLLLPYPLQEVQVNQKLEQRKNW